MSFACLNQVQTHTLSNHLQFLDTLTSYNLYLNIQLKINTVLILKRVKNQPKLVKASSSEPQMDCLGVAIKMCNLTAATAFPPQILPSLIGHQ